MLSDALAIIANAVNDVITTPPQGISNITEWAKKEACWSRLLDQVDAIAGQLSEEFWAGLCSADENRFEAKTARQTQKIDNGIEIQRRVFSIPSGTWRSIGTQLAVKRLLTPKETGVIDTAAQMPSKVPSEAQCRVLVGILEKAKDEGMSVPD